MSLESDPRFMALLSISNQMEHEAAELRARGMEREAGYLAQLALGVWSVMHEVGRRSTKEVNQ